MKLEDLPKQALEVTDTRTGDVVGWVWQEQTGHSCGHHACHPHMHWRYATACDDGVHYTSPYGFLERKYAVARVAVTKNVVSHHLRVEGDS